VAGLVALPAMLLGGAVLTVVQLASQAPGFGVWLAAPALWWLALWYVTLAIWAVRDGLARGRILFLAGVLLLVAGLIGGVVLQRAPRGAELTVCDVGDGQAVLLRLPSGHNLMLDAGARSVSRQEDVSEMLWHSGVMRLDAVVLSHYDADHCNFTPALLDRFRVKRVVVRQVVDLSPGADRTRALLRATAEAAGTRLQPISQAVGIAAPGMTCRVLHPNTAFLGRSGPKSVAENDRSLVLMIECEGVRILFTGDIGSLAMQRLVADYGEELRADVLMLPHHGDFKEGFAELLVLVRPAVAIASGTEQACDPGTRAALAEHGVSLWMTGREGAIMLEARDGRIALQGWKSGRTEVLQAAD
jgi:competence protein ComEC